MEKQTPSDPKNEIQLPFPGKISELPEPNGPGRAERSLDYLFKRPKLTWDESTGFHRGPRSPGRGYRLMAWSMLAGFIDSLLLFSTSCFLLIGFSKLMKSNLIQVFAFFQESNLEMGFLALGGLIAMYLVIFRVFLGFTIGEWTCGLRIGLLKQRLHRSYALRVLGRTILVFSTGLVLLPILSLLFGRDIPGLLLRIPLIEKKDF